MAKEMRRMEIEPAENGGHTVTHHYKEERPKGSRNGMMAGTYHEPESHVFGPEDGHEMLAHVANHLGIKEMEEDEGHGDDEVKGKSGDNKLGSKSAARIREKVGKY